MKMEKEVKNLSTIEWKIYNYLKERTEKDLWSNQKDVLEYLDWQGILISSRKLRTHIQNIRKCEIIQKVILTDYVKGYRIMSDEEQYQILLNRKIAILKSLKQFHRDKKRLQLNDQMKLNFDSKEREFIESLLKVD